MNIKFSELVFCLLLGSCVSAPNKPTTLGVTPPLAQPATLSNFKAACPATVLRPAVFRKEQKEVLVFDGSPNFENIPAEIEWHSFTVQVEPARFPNETTPAEYEETTRTIDIERGRSELFATPATYRTLTRRILVKDTHQRWKPNCISPEGKDCIETVPAEYKEMKVDMVDMPAHTEQRHVPGRTQTLKIKKRIKQATGTGKPIPAVYETIKVARVIKPWQIKSLSIPSRYETLETQRMLRPERVLTQPSICPNALTTEQIGQIQAQLLKSGYTLTANQQLDKPTWQAILKFQQDNGLDTGAITPETLLKLGLT